MLFLILHLCLMLYASAVPIIGGFYPTKLRNSNVIVSQSIPDACLSSSSTSCALSISTSPPFLSLGFPSFHSHKCSGICRLPCLLVFLLVIVLSVEMFRPSAITTYEVSFLLFHEAPLRNETCHLWTLVPFKLPHRPRASCGNACPFFLSFFPTLPIIAFGSMLSVGRLAVDSDAALPSSSWSSSSLLEYFHLPLLVLIPTFLVWRCLSGTPSSLYLLAPLEGVPLSRWYELIQDLLCLPYLRPCSCTYS